MQLIGPTYNLESRPASVQRTVNLVPVPLEPGNERAGWVFKDVPGLVSAVSDWDEAAPPPPPGPPALTGEIDFTALATGWSVSGPGSRSASLFGDTATITFASSSNNWLGATDPACPSSFPTVVGCLDGFNGLFNGYARVAEPASPTWDSGALVQAFEVDCILQIRPTTDSFDAEVRIANGDFIFGVRFKFARSPAESYIAALYGEFVAEEVAVYDVDLEDTTPLTIRVEISANTGSPSEDYVRIFYNGTQVAISTDAFYPAPEAAAVSGVPRIEALVTAATSGGDSGLFNVTAIRLIEWS